MHFYKKQAWHDDFKLLTHVICMCCCRFLYFLAPAWCMIRRFENHILPYVLDQYINDGNDLWWRN